MPITLKNAARGLVAALLIATPMVVAAAPASADPVHISYRSRASPSDSALHKSVNVVCPTGMKVIGGSFHLEGAPGQIVLDDFIPYDTPLGNGNFVSGLIVAAGEIVNPGEPSGTGERWLVQGTAVCAFPPSGYSIRAVTSGVSSIITNSVDSPCPPARRLLGGGASLSQGFGQVSIQHIAINSQGIQARAKEDGNGFSGNWSVTAYAICADPVNNWHAVGVPSPEGIDVAITQAAFCPRGQVVIGSLYSILANSGLILTTDRYVTTTDLSSFPDPGVTVNVRSTAPFGGVHWQVQATAVCADGNVVPAP